MKFKTIQELRSTWQKTSFVLGAGPSLSSFNLSLLEGISTIAVNNAVQLWPLAQVLFYMDIEWERNWKSLISEFEGTVISLTDSSMLSDIKMKRAGEVGFPSNDIYLPHGDNSGFGAVCLAFLLGSTKVILVGFDMQEVNGKANFHPHNRKTAKEIYLHWHKNFERLAIEIHKRNLTALNATPNSALKAFDFTNFETEARSLSNAIYK